MSLRDLRYRVCVSLWLGACTSSAPSDGRPTGDSAVLSCEEGTLALGTGEFTFAALEENGVLNMVYGEQGGYHVPLAARACGVGESGMFHYTGTIGTGEHTGAPIVDVSLAQVWLPEDACCSVALDVYGYIFLYGYDITPPDLAGESLDLTVEVTDSSGAMLTDAIRVTLGPPAR